MHEIGMCEGLVELIRERAGGRRVTSARVRVGARHAVVDDAFGQAFTMAAAGTPAQDAELELVITPMTVRCDTCGSNSESVDALAVCPVCGADDVDVSGGDELVLESVSFGEEVPDVSRHPR
ncbi:hydrogenase maturation nickel metallochaperone HypA [Nonomuraea phyllanthi]|uniref:Hydrogenase maturation factor HypA n=1 Tax=Nonomuraea phyllanthi TaxID=2219224 RepID=A0A5C4W3P0_9ACTN|nr:hydrogenase maturation nickel metallochaperone HypA [Nonomuraea phyllanthi]KAB8191544.1 hydrogenase maturation nickel metallochaperone HypA [Nonomuraea phyllanthi]QFY13129.1 hydrogenase maturation nickel metallochaperone HypA [Nonomuraea phyllanthi]